MAFLQIAPLLAMLDRTEKRSPASKESEESFTEILDFFRSEKGIDNHEEKPSREKFPFIGKEERKTERVSLPENEKEKMGRKGRGTHESDFPRRSEGWKSLSSFLLFSSEQEDTSRNDLSTSVSHSVKSDTKKRNDSSLPFRSPNNVIEEKFPEAVVKRNISPLSIDTFLPTEEESPFMKKGNGPEEKVKNRSSFPSSKTREKGMEKKTVSRNVSPNVSTPFTFHLSGKEMDALREREESRIATRERIGEKPSPSLGRKDLFSSRTETPISPSSRTVETTKRTDHDLHWKFSPFPVENEEKTHTVSFSIKNDHPGDEVPFIARTHMAVETLEKEVNIARNTHALRHAKTFEELILFADRTGLNLEKIRFDETEEVRKTDHAGEKTRENSKASLHIPRFSAEALAKSRRKISPNLSMKADSPWKSVEGKGREQTIPDNSESGISPTSISTNDPKPSLKGLMEKLEKGFGSFSKRDSFDVSISSSRAGENPGEEESGSRQIPTMEKKEEGFPESERIERVGSENITKSEETLHRKIADAKATVRHFARTLREEVESYKPPFQRMQLSLDPKELGSVEVTLISRGNNLHIHVNANPAAIGTMATQGQELRNQLVSMGFSDVQMQFNMNQQKQQQENRRPLSSEKREEREEYSTNYESIHMIVPHYI